MRAAAALRAEDGAVIETALIHFLDDLTVEHFGRIGAKTLLLQDRTVEQAGMIGPDQLSSELKDFAFPDDAVRDMRARHAGTVLLRELPLKEPRIILTDSLRVNEIDSLMGFHTRFPDAKGWAHIWLPGYSNDGSRAVIRFWHGPTPHGAVATYVLRRGDAGEWTVLDRKLTYFL